MKSSLFLYSYKNKHELCSLSDTLTTKWSSLPQRWDQFSVTCNMCCCLLSAHAKTCLRRDYENRTAHTRLRKYTRKNYNIQIQEILPSYWSDQMIYLPPLVINLFHMKITSYLNVPGPGGEPEAGVVWQAELVVWGRGGHWAAGDQGVSRSFKTKQ